MRRKRTANKQKKDAPHFYISWSLHCFGPTIRRFAIFIAGESNDFLLHHVRRHRGEPFSPPHNVNEAARQRGFCQAFERVPRFYMPWVVVRALGYARTLYAGFCLAATNATDKTKTETFIEATTLFCNSLGVMCRERLQ